MNNVAEMVGRLVAVLGRNDLLSFDDALEVFGIDWQEAAACGLAREDFRD